MLDETRSRAVLEVDGGITRETIHACWQAGADTFVAGVAVFGAACFAMVALVVRALQLGECVAGTLGELHPRRIVRRTYPLRIGRYDRCMTSTTAWTVRTLPLAELPVEAMPSLIGNVVAVVFVTVITTL